MITPRFTKKIDIWAFVYVSMVIFLSIAQVEFSVFVFVIYFVMAVPFLYHVEQYVAITLLLSTISYYFVGAGSGFWSMPTILLLLIVLRILLNKKGKIVFEKRNILIICLLIVIATLSYYHSSFGYTNGWFGLEYVLVISLVVGNFIELDLRKLVRALFVVTYTLIIGYFLTVFISGLFVDGRLTIANDVNTNTFGKSCAQLATICITAAILYKSNRIRNIVFGLAISVLSLLTGSRGSLIAFILAIVLTSVVYAYRNRILSGTMLKIVIGGVVVLFIFGSFGTMFEIDVTRFTISRLLESRRSLIYQYVIPYVVNNGYWVLGYGPGHDCSRQVIRSLVGWNFAHTHNTFLEAFAELGVFGLALTLFCTVSSLKNIANISAKSKEGYILFALLVCLLINSLAESFFCNYVFWCLLALCRKTYDLSSDE